MVYIALSKSKGSTFLHVVEEVVFSNYRNDYMSVKELWYLNWSWLKSKSKTSGYLMTTRVSWLQRSPKDRKLPVLHSVIGVVCNIGFFSLLKKSVRTNLEWIWQADMIRKLNLCRMTTNLSYILGAPLKHLWIKLWNLLQQRLCLTVHHVQMICAVEEIYLGEGRFLVAIRPTIVVKIDYYT